MSFFQFPLGLRQVVLGAALGAAFLVAPVQVQAQVLTSNGSLGETHAMSLNAGVSYSPTWRGANSFTDGASTFWAYCIDPRTGYANSTSYTSTSLANFMTGGRYASQFGQAAYTSTASTGYVAQSTSVVQNSLMNLFAHAYADSLTSTVKAAAFSYAVWEVLGESSYNTNTGGLRSNEVSAWRTQTDAYLSALSTNSWSSVNGANLNAAMSYIYTVYYTAAQGASQSFLRVLQNTGTGVPEPGSMALTLLGLMGVAHVARRNRKPMPKSTLAAGPAAV
jgi:hypothetical protein